MSTTRDYLQARERDLLGRISELRELERELAEVRSAMAALGMPIDRAPTSPADMTMKQLVMKALEDHFQDGCTSKQLIVFFRDAWGREVKRANLSPQLYRLVHDDRALVRDGHKYQIIQNPRVAT